MKCKLYFNKAAKHNRKKKNPRSSFFQTPMKKYHNGDNGK